MTHLCEHCGKTFGRKADLTKHFNIYHKNRCTICNYKCECIDTHMEQCVKYNDKLQNILNAFDNQNEVTEILRRKFNNSEYIDIYKVAYALFAYDTVFPNSYFMPSHLLAQYLCYGSHKDLLDLIFRILIENEDYIKEKQEYIKWCRIGGIVPPIRHHEIIEPSRKEKEPVYLNYNSVLKIFTHSTLEVAKKHSEIILFCYNLIMRYHAKEQYTTLEQTMNQMRLELSSKLDDAHKAHQETRLELTSKLDTLIEQNRKLEIKLAKCTPIITETHNKVESLVSKKSSVKEPKSITDIESVVILEKNNEYVFSCRQRKSISKFMEKYKDYNIFARYDNINNAKYFIKFLVNNKIVTTHNRKLKPNIPIDTLKSRLDSIYNDTFRTIADPVEQRQIKALIYATEDILESDSD